MTEKARKPITVGFVSLGCPKNVVDSERMLAQIAQADMLITTEPGNVDAVVINTCGFIAPAKAEALDAIREAAGWDYRETNRDRCGQRKGYPLFRCPNPARKQ